MAKSLVPEKVLIEIINTALADRWPDKEHTCRVLTLKRVDLPERNWEVESFGSGGVDLLHTSDCDDLRQLVLEGLVRKYDVEWPN